MISDYNDHPFLYRTLASRSVAVERAPFSPFYPMFRVGPSCFPAWEYVLSGRGDASARRVRFAGVAVSARWANPRADRLAGRLAGRREFASAWLMAWLKAYVP